MRRAKKVRYKLCEQESKRAGAETSECDLLLLPVDDNPYTLRWMVGYGKKIVTQQTCKHANQIPIYRIRTGLYLHNLR